MVAVISKIIEVEENGVAWISGMWVKVIEVAIDKLAHDSTPEEMHAEYPHLSLAQIYAALAYYYEHKAEFDAKIQQQLDKVKALAEAAKDSPGRQCLQKLGLIQ